MSRRLATLILIFASIVWGFAFIAQKSAMESLEPLSFIAARCLLGGLAVLPIALFERRSRRTPIEARDWRLIGLASVAFFLASWLQQQGLITTTATNGGFLTGLYVLFVPAILLIGVRIRPHPIIWASTLLALLGLYLLNGARLDRFAVGDALIVGSALFWALHVLLLGHLVRLTALPIFVSAVIFLLAGVY
ncbi:MAG: DMT family transporter, partial [Cucumibacter sp.]